MSQLVTLKYLRSVSKLCNYRYNLTLSIPLLKHFSTVPARFEPNFQNPSDYDGVNDQNHSGFRGESEYNAKGQFTGNFAIQAFNQTHGGHYVQDHRNENLNGPGGKNGNFSGGYRQENSRSEFRNDTGGGNWGGSGGLSREGRVNESHLSGYYRQSSGQFAQQPGVFNDSRGTLSGVLDSGGVQQRQNQFHGEGSSEVNVSYGQNGVHSQQISGNYAVGNENNVSHTQQGTHNNFHGNNYYGNFVGNHQQRQNSYHGNYADSFNGYLLGNVGGYQQNPTVEYHSNTVEYQNGTGFQVAGNSTTVGGIVEASEKRTVEEIKDLCGEGKLKEAIELLVLLENDGTPVGMDQYYMLMKACRDAQALEEAKHVHDLFIRRNFPYEVRSFNNILEMYCMCGSMDDAYAVFNKMPQRNLTSWDTMILWFAKNGRGEEAIDLFTRFKELGLRPDGEIFFSIFTACSFLGDITEGLLHFKSMSKQYSIVPLMQHYVAIVDMLGKTGYLDEALEFVENMPVEPSIDVWENLMNSCRIHGYMELGDRCAELVELLDPSRLTEQAKAGLIPVNASDIAKEKEKRKLISRNIMDVRSRVHEYRAGDTSHPDNDKIYALLRGLRQQMKEAGYVAETKFVLHDIDHEGKEDALLAHSERLAVAQGLISSPARQQIRIIKNLRVCGDCHNAMKIISKLVGRELIMRDAKRFHHFKDGVCSCRDYW
ncbi:pentatricopeptide repeat-containing protein At4g32450, mitochondrial-like [Apium graveolens]|uniref:pentatricopeptide repeat-containing protein At4g32450, mitochondrial-like n=1 Tax=Apium graveolens TaxID=4045 RepID=UPI003D7B7AF6